jgi:hypothetical protein
MYLGDKGDVEAMVPHEAVRHVVRVVLSSHGHLADLRHSATHNALAFPRATAICSRSIRRHTCLLGSATDT